MILYRNNASKTKPRIERTRRTLNIEIEEKPERPRFLDRTARERRKFITKVEQMVRSSDEYKEYIKYLKTHFDMSHCEVFPNVSTGNGKKYSIEIHHEPFQLSWIVDTVIHKRQELDEDLDPFSIADEVMKLHYDGVIGLIPLCVTAHELGKAAFGEIGAEHHEGKEGRNQSIQTGGNAHEDIQNGPDHRKYPSRR